MTAEHREEELEGARPTPRTLPADFPKEWFWCTSRHSFEGASGGPCCIPVDVHARAAPAVSTIEPVAWRTFYGEKVAYSDGPDKPISSSMEWYPVYSEPFGAIRAALASPPAQPVTGCTHGT